MAQNPYYRCALTRVSATVPTIHSEPVPAAMRFLFLLPLLFLLPACKTQRTVLAGPQKISAGGYNDFNPNASNEQLAAQMAATGQSQTGGGSGFNERFGFDSGGYGSEGLNAMSGKMFGGETKSKDMKDFSQTKDFLTKRYGGTKGYGTKEYSDSGTRSWLAGRRARTGSASEAGQEYSGGRRLLGERNYREAGRTITGRTSREASRTANTRAYYPAEKMLTGDRDEPKIIGEGSKKESHAVWELIKSRPRDNPASVQEIRDLLGKP
jgi:hypothetical protein